MSDLTATGLAGVALFDAIRNDSCVSSAECSVELIVVVKLSAVLIAN